jgi:hypothetical protein
MTTIVLKWLTSKFPPQQRTLTSNFVAARLDETEHRPQRSGNLGNV